LKKRSLFLLMIAALTVAASGEDVPGPKDVRIRPDQVYGHKFGMAMTFDAYLPKNANRAAVIFISSGGYESGKSRQCEKDGDSEWRFIPIDSAGKWDLPRLILEQYGFDRLLAAGFTVFEVRHGSSPKFTIDEMFEDCSRAVRHIKFHARDYGIDADRIGLWGGSAGGHLALLLGAHVVQGQTKYRDLVGAFELLRFTEPELSVSSSVNAVGVYYPAGYDLVADSMDYPDVLKALPAWHVDRSVLADMSVKKYIGPSNPPVLIIYGDQDFPFITGACRNIAADLEKNGVEVKTVVLPGVEHEFKNRDGYANAEPGRKAMSELVAWFTAKLLDRPSPRVDARGRPSF
jgi:acetyl esterase/lipase